MNIKRSSDAFTLVEVLVSLLIISMLAGMVVTAVQGVTQTAREARTRTLIAAISTVIDEQYESYKYRPLPVETPVFATTDVETPVGSGTFITFGFEVLGVEAARVRLIMKRDLMRMELPDKKLDIVASSGTAIQMPVTITAVANRTAADASGRIRRDYDTNRSQTAISWSGSQKLGIYYDRYISAGSTWTTEHEGAECLYMIMATTFVGGSPAIDVIPITDIGDTDGDGMPEILDAWGQPLGFVRWPRGYVDPGGLLDMTIPDEFDPFKADFGFHVTGVSGVIPPYSLRPLIVSAGSDAEFGMTLSSNTVAYNAQAWPLTHMDTGTATPIGNENFGRTGTYYFPDPFLRHSPPTPLPGAIDTTTPDLSADNITNFSLEASQ